MNVLAVIRRCLGWPCRLVERMAVGHAQERAEMRLLPQPDPTVRINDVGDVTIDIADGQHDRLPDDERTELDTFAVDFRRWSVAMWDGLDADKIARRGERAGWDR